MEGSVSPPTQYLHQVHGVNDHKHNLSHLHQLRPQVPRHLILLEFIPVGLRISRVRGQAVHLYRQMCRMLQVGHEAHSEHLKGRRYHRHQ